MTCCYCKAHAKKSGKFKTANGSVQRYRCLSCGKTFKAEGPLGDMRISEEKAVQILNMLVEGVGINAASRLTGVHKETVLRVLALAGERCERILDEKIRNVTVEQVQADEIWSFVHCKQKNVRRGQDDRAIGDQYTWVALDPKSKLVISYIVGKRSGLNALALMTDLCGRLANRTQLTTDGFAPYVGAVEDVFGADIDFAQLIKIYANPTEERRGRYSPSECIGAVPTSVTGNPDPEMICTSHVERSNLTMRTFIRRMTRLCLGFSKKLDNLKAAVALYFAWYNFVRIHGSLKVTPAMEAGITDHVWTIGELIGATI